MKTKIVSWMPAMFLFSLLLVPAVALAQITGHVNTSIGGINISVGNGGPWLMNPYGLPQGSIMGIIGALSFWLLAAFGFFGMIGFIIAGIMYLTASGDDDQAKKAKNAMKFSIMGIVVGIIGFVVIQAVNTWLNEGTYF